MEKRVSVSKTMGISSIVGVYKSRYSLSHQNEKSYLPPKRATPVKEIH
jgi:hypothetical protein